MKELFTEQNQNTQESNIITIPDIYKAIPHLEEKDRIILLSTYKLTDLYQMMNDQAGLEEYLNNMVEQIKYHTDLVYVLINLYNGVVDNSSIVESDQIENIGRIYDSLSDESKGIICEQLMNNQKFFGDVLADIVSKFANTVEDQKQDV